MQVAVIGADSRMSPPSRLRGRGAGMNAIPANISRMRTACLIFGAAA